MKARLLAALPAIVVAITPFTALAQSTTKPARVGILLDDSAAPTPLWNECLERLEPFRKELESRESLVIP